MGEVLLDIEICLVSYHALAGFFEKFELCRFAAEKRNIIICADGDVIQCWCRHVGRICNSRRRVA